MPLRSRVATLAVCLVAALLVTGPLTAQGPRLQESRFNHALEFPEAFTVPVKAAPAVRSETHWKRGALIGFVVGMIPGLLFSTGGEECDTSAYIGVACGTAKAANVVVGGILGAVIGGFIGSRSAK